MGQEASQSEIAQGLPRLDASTELALNFWCMSD